MVTQPPAIAVPPTEETPFDYQASGTFGLHSATWQQIRSVLVMFGGKPERSTKKEQSTLYTMPSGTRIAAGKASHVNNKVMFGAMQQVMQEIRRAELPPILFLGAMDNVGASFISKTADISKASRFIRDERPDLSNWKEALHNFHQWMKRIEEKPVEPEQATVEPKATIREFKYTLREAAELSGADRITAQNYASTIANMIRSDSGIGAELKEKGLLQTEQKAQRTYYKVDEAGALLIGKYVEERLIELGKKEGDQEAKPPEVQKPRITPTDVRSAETEVRVQSTKPHITLDHSAVTMAIMEYLARRHFDPAPEIAFTGVNERSFSATVEIHWLPDGNGTE